MVDLVWDVGIGYLPTFLMSAECDGTRQNFCLAQANLTALAPGRVERGKKGHCSSPPEQKSGNNSGNNIRDKGWICFVPQGSFAQTTTGLPLLSKLTNHIAGFLIRLKV
ncbi:hypothetical protein V2G26_019073 [Clonostachys chloroleuca]